MISTISAGAVNGLVVHRAITSPRTIDIDYRIELTSSDDGEFIQALRATQRLITLNVEAASPADFIPLPQGWRERSTFLTREGGLTIYAFDPLSTALAKIERGQQRDSDDVLTGAVPDQGSQRG